ncbi:MAG: ThuA domain-containing protein [Chitinophagaceae bacterium]
MKKFLKILGWSILILIILAVSGMALFIYKIKNGFPVSYETTIPSINFPKEQPAILLFSKSTGFRHSESIEAGKKSFDDLARKNNWFIYSTEEGGVFNKEQLSRFDVVIFNNCTGRLLNPTQQETLQNYVLQGGNWIGIHGAGDNSHRWDWYDENLVSAKFSHHALKKHIQEADVVLNHDADSLLIKDLSPGWKQSDEWYVFFNNPQTKGANILYTIDGDKIDPDGNILWIKDKNFGMGKNHPVAWYKNVGKGTSYYTSMGHDSAAWQQSAFINMLETEIKISIKNRHQ